MNIKLQLDCFSGPRCEMVESQLRKRGIYDERVLGAMATVPRDVFVNPEYRKEVYEDHPIPIEGGQTLSQPFIVARMLQALALTSADNVLEIGTGSGYQTALLAKLAQSVVSIERISFLAEKAATRLVELGITNVSVLVGDGSKGAPGSRSFDAIVVSAAAPEVPASLFLQLKEGGRMIIPVGAPHAQELKLVSKQEGKAVIQNLEGCRFVPLIGEEGYKSGW